MQTQELNQLRQTIQTLFPDEITDLKNDFDREFFEKTGSKDALHQVIKKERKQPHFCDECGSLHIVKNGKTSTKRQKYRCVDCGKSCSDTYKSISASSKKPYHIWEAFIICMMNGFSLRKTSSLIDISTPTAFHWRHKVMEAMKNYDKNRKLQENIQMDETYFLLNMKGLQSLPRKAKKRKEDSQKRGVNNEHVCVLTAIDSNDQILIDVIDQGNPKTNKIIKALEGNVKMGQTIITDSKTAYRKVAKHFKSELHQIPSGFYRKGSYNLGEINEIHSSMKTWLVPFKGVSTKHLSRYLAWFRFNKLLHMHQETSKHNRIVMNYSIQEIVDFLICEIHSTPFPVDITLPYL